MKLYQIKKDIKVILISGYAEQDIMKRYPNNKFSGFIHKPYQYKDLAVSLLKIISSDNV
jgi:YesN/AraC family two-component response regulator